MKRKIIAALGMAAVFVGTISATVCAEEIIKNASFEIWTEGAEYLTDWSISNDTTMGAVTGKWLETGSQDGDVTLCFWSDKEYHADVYQTLEGLTPGVYTLSAYTQSGSFKDDVCYLYAKDSTESEIKADIPVSETSWTTVSVSGITVGEDGKLTIGVCADGLANSWAYVDAVTLTEDGEESMHTGKTGEKEERADEGAILNNSFEAWSEDAEYLTGWTLSEDSTTDVVSGKWLEEGSQDGDVALCCWAEEDYLADVSQEISGLEPGYYYLTGYVQNWGSQKNTYLYAHGSGQSDSMTTIPLTYGGVPEDAGWRQVVVRGIEVGDDGKAEIGLHAEAYGNGSLYLDNLVLMREMDQSEPYRLLKGGDVSELTWMEQEGTLYYDEEGNQGDALQLLSENGCNFVRLRLYNNPGKGRGDGTYYCKDGIQDAEDILNLAKRAADKGMEIELSFHYSDYWSNGATQYIPQEWQNEIEGLDDSAAVDKLEELLYDYTYDFMERMAAQGTVPAYVTLGNETEGGLLFPYGKTAVETWENLARFYTAGCKAVKDACPDTKVGIHLNDAGNEYKYTEYFGHLVEYGVPFDFIGGSYYPFWTDLDVDSIVDFCDNMIRQFGKDILIMETGYAFNMTIADESSPWPLGQLGDNGCYPDEGDAYGRTPEGQRHFMEDLFNGLKRVGLGTENKCIGDLYWDPIFVEQEGKIGWACLEETDEADTNAISNTTLFDFDHKLLPVMKAYQNNKEGVKTGDLAGRIVSSDDAAAGIAECTVLLTINEMPYEVTTDRYGAFYLRDLPAAESQTVKLEADGLIYGENIDSIDIIPGEISEIEFEMIGARITGKVTDDKGKSVAGADVYAKNATGSCHTVVQEDGTYCLNGLSEGEYEIYAEAKGYTFGEPVKASVSIGEIKETQDLGMTLASGTVTGYIVDENGSPVNHAAVTAIPVNNTVDGKETAVTDADGKYELCFLTATEDGTAWTISTSAEGYKSQETEVTVKTGEVSDELSFDLQKDVGNLSGSIVDIQGNPVEGASVELWLNGASEATSSMLTDTEGGFSAQDIPSGWYTIYINKDGYMQNITSYEEVTFSETTEAETVILPVTVEIVNGGFETSGDPGDEWSMKAEGWNITATESGTNGPGARRQERESFGGAFEGTYGLSIWLDQRFEADVNQTVTKLNAGKYVLRANIYSGITGEFYLYAKNGEKVLSTCNIEQSGTYQPVTMEFELDEDADVVIGFYTNTAGGDWAVVDQVELGYLGKQ